MNDEVVIVQSTAETVTVPERIVEVTSIGIQGPPGVGASTDATPTSKGVLKLAGDLSGTANAPTVPGLAATVSTSTTVNGHALSANVTVTKSDVGLGSVDNTSDANKNAASGTLTNKTISGASNTLSDIEVTSLDATGTPSSSTFLRGDGSWSVPAGAGGGITEELALAYAVAL